MFKVYFFRIAFSDGFFSSAEYIFPSISAVSEKVLFLHQVLDVRWQKRGSDAGSIREAGSATTRATCEFGGLDTKSTYYVYAYANISGTRVESEKKTLTIR